MADVRRFDPAQKRDPDGKWGDGIPGPGLPDLDLGDADLISEADGTFGKVLFGVDPSGDVRMAFHQGFEARELDLGGDEVQELRDALDGLADERERFGIDGSADDEVDSHWFGYDQAHRATLWGNGLIEVTFGAEEDDPWNLVLDPPSDEDDDVQALVDAIDAVLNEIDATRSTSPAAAEARRFNPNQKRDPNGEWGDGIPGPSAGAIGDALSLAGRIELDPDERLVSSSRIHDGSGDMDMNFAVVHNPDGNDVRIGIIPAADSDKWRAANLGGTALLESHELRQFRDDLKSAAADGKRLAAEADKAWNSGKPPTDPVLLGTDPVAKGTLPNLYSDLEWHVYLNDESWELTIGAGGSLGEDVDGIKFDPKATTKLLKHLDGIQTQVDADSARSTSRGGRMDLHAAQVGDLRYNDQHAPAGSANGGQFTSGGGGGQDKKPAPPKRTPDGPRKPRKPAPHADSGTLSYDPKSNHGTGYDSREGDPRVHALQQALNRLGIKDSGGKALKDDGRLGPKTTSAVKALQTRLGLKPDGKVTPALLAQIKGMKSLPAAKTLHAMKRRSAVMDFCVRSFGFEFEERARTSDGRTLEGYAAVFDTPTRIAAVGGDFDEVISRGAFTRSIRSRMPVLQFEHGRDPRVGAVPIGSIDDLAEDSRGLHVRATLFDNPVVEPVRQAIAGRAIKGMSFRFNVADGGDAWERRTGNVDLRTVGDADVHELGPVVFPAYDSTTVSVRSLLAQLGPEEHLTLLRELAHDLRSIEPTGVGPSARSSGGADLDQDQEREEPQLSIRQRLDQGALRSRGILK